MSTHKPALSAAYDYRVDELTERATMIAAIYAVLSDEALVSDAAYLADTLRRMLDESGWGALIGDVDTHAEATRAWVRRVVLELT